MDRSEKIKANLDASNTSGRVGLAKARRGELPAEAYKHRSFAEIKNYNAKTNTYDILVQGGDARLIPNVCIKTDGSGAISPLPSGTTVILDESLSVPIIDGVIPGMQETVYTPETSTAPRLGSASPIPLEDAENQCNDSDNYRTADLPTDAMPGEFVRITPEGNYLGILRGKLNVLSAGEKAQIFIDGGHELVKTICEDYEHVSSLGTVTIKNEEGRSSLVARFAADQLTEGGGKEEQWTFRLDIGNSGNIFKMEVTEGDGKTKAKFQISPDGRVTIVSTNGFHQIDAGEGVNHAETAGSKSTRIKGSSKLDVQGDINVNTASSRKTSISATDSKMVGNDDAVFINRDYIRSVGRNQDITVTGGTTTEAKPGNIAVHHKVLNGSYVLNIGDPALGASPAAMAGYSLFIHNGNIVIGEDPASPAILATVSLNTLKPDSIALGGTIETAQFHAMLYEQWQILMTTLMGLLDTHIHPPMAPPAVPMSPTIAATMNTVKSVKVKIGL